MNKLIIISGATASGKTKISIEAAKWIQEKFGISVSIVNFDSLLFYKEISIGTAKPTTEEMQGISHFMIGIESIKSPINAAEFVKRCEEIINFEFQKNKIIILVGGSAFYLRALLKGMYQPTPLEDDVKNKFDALYEKEGISPFLEYLKKNDPQSLVNLHSNDHYRIIRAVQYFESTGLQISAQKKILDELNPYDFSTILQPWMLLHIYLEIPRPQHLQIIAERTLKMFNDGLMEELEVLLKNGFSLNEKPLNSIGYKEAIEFKKGKFKNIEECIDKISVSTRQLAKSQRTFFKKITPKESFNPLSEYDKIIETIFSFISKQN